MFWKHTRWAFLWALFIAFLCGIPGRDLPHISFLELLAFDKWVHAGVFFVLFVLPARGFLLQASVGVFHASPRSWALLLCVVYGGVLELLQDAVFEERSADLYDFIANSAGCLLGLALFDRLIKKISFLRIPS